MSEKNNKDETQTLAEALVAAVRRAARYNADIESAPHCILWTDREQQWQSVIPQLQRQMPELLVLGDYEPERRRGPAIWLRCASARVLDDVVVPSNATPVLYLPGVGRPDLRAVESCPQALRPLAELQYRGEIWKQVNAKDWTVLAFLRSEQGGLGLDGAQVRNSKRAMLRALGELIDQDVALLRGKRRDATYFNTLLAGGDPTRDLLQWLDEAEAFKATRSAQEWAAPFLCGLLWHCIRPLSGFVRHDAVMHKRLFLLCLFMPIIIGGCASAPRSARHNADSYCVAGHGCYRVVKSATGYTAEGQASWYGRGDAGKPTASGAPYDPRAMRIANKKLPFGTWVKIVNLDNHREAVAMVNDRGPFARNRIIDGTLAVAQRLGYYRAGTAPVRIIAIPETQLSQAQKEAARANKQHAIAYARSHKDHVWAEAGHVAVRGVVDVTKTGLKIGVGTAFAVLKTGGDIAFKTLTILL